MAANQSIFQISFGFTIRGEMEFPVRLLIETRGEMEFPKVYK